MQALLQYLCAQYVPTCKVNPGFRCFTFGMTFTLSIDTRVRRS